MKLYLKQLFILYVQKVCLLSCFNHVPLFATQWTVNPPGSSVHGILQARILEWVAVSASRGFCGPRDRTDVCYVSRLGRRLLHY